MKKFLSYKTRSTWKSFNILVKKKNVFSNRAYVVRLIDVGKEVYVYSGKILYKFNILNKHIGYKLGQFFLTKKLGGNHLKKKIINLKKAQVKKQKK